jgi:hypothetical protein
MTILGALHARLPIVQILLANPDLRLFRRFWWFPVPTRDVYGRCEPRCCCYGYAPHYRQGHQCPEGMAVRLSWRKTSFRWHCRIDLGQFEEPAFRFPRLLQAIAVPRRDMEAIHLEPWGCAADVGAQSHRNSWDRDEHRTNSGSGEKPKELEVSGGWGSAHSCTRWSVLHVGSGS